MEVINIITFGPYAFLGLLISLVMDIYSSGIKLNEFSLIKWISDNGIRLILSILVLIAGLTFSEDIFGAKLSPLVSFWAGIGNDNLINMFVRRKDKLKKEE